MWPGRSPAIRADPAPPYHRNFGKRLVKTPKLYFLDAGQKAGRIAGEEARMPWLIHGGTESYERSGVKVIPWRALAEPMAGA